MYNIYKCFPEGKHKVLTMSYDDGKSEDRRLVEIFNENGIKGTFHLNSGLFDDVNRINPEEVKEVYKGHEVATHTLTHPTIARSPKEQFVQQILEDRKKKQYLYMMYVWGHSYEFDRDNNWELIEGFCKYISNRNDIWYATNIQIVDYLKALDNLKFSSACNFVYNPSFINLWLSIDGKIIEVKGGTQKDLL